MKEIPITRGRVAFVDDEDFDRLAGFKWWAQVGNTGIWYARTQTHKLESGRWARSMMHRLIVEAPPGLLVDHINGNGLDNVRSNLRVCTYSQNCHNQRAKRGASPFKGVGWHKWERKWTANITPPGGRQTTLGYFTCEEEAARAYDAAALMYFGEFARLNFQAEASR